MDEKILHIVEELLNGNEVECEHGTFCLSENYDLLVKAKSSSGEVEYLNTFYSLRPLVELAEKLIEDTYYATMIIQGNSSGFIDGPTRDVQELIGRQIFYPTDEGTEIYIVKLKKDGKHKKILKQVSDSWEKV